MEDFWTFPGGNSGFLNSLFTEGNNLLWRLNRSALSSSSAEWAVQSPPSVSAESRGHEIDNHMDNSSMKFIFPVVLSTWETVSHDPTSLKTSYLPMMAQVNAKGHVLSFWFH